MPIDKQVALKVCSKKKVPMFLLLYVDGKGKIQPMERKETWIRNKGGGWKFTEKCPVWLKKGYKKMMEKE